MKRKQVKEYGLREELRALKLDWLEALKQGDKTGVVEIQERIDGLERIYNG